jgi:hypothetical protein
VEGLDYMYTIIRQTAGERPQPAKEGRKRKRNSPRERLRLILFSLLVLSLSVVLWKFNESDFVFIFIIFSTIPILSFFLFPPRTVNASSLFFSFFP